MIRLNIGPSTVAYIGANTNIQNQTDKGREEGSYQIHIFSKQLLRIETSRGSYLGILAACKCKIASPSNQEKLKLKSEPKQLGL